MKIHVISSGFISITLMSSSLGGIKYMKYRDIRRLEYQIHGVPSWCTNNNWRNLYSMW